MTGPDRSLNAFDSTAAMESENCRNLVFEPRGVTKPHACESASGARFSPRGLEHYSYRNVPANQNTKPIRTKAVRGCRKCVPLKVDKKLYSATLLVRLAMSTDAVMRLWPSVWSRLSVPKPRLNTLRGFTRSGLWSSFSWLSKLSYPP